MVATLYQAKVFHRRLRPTPHDLSYNLWALKIDLSALDRLAEQNLLGGTSPLSLDPQDFGPRDGSPLADWFRGQLAHHGYGSDGPLEFLFLPRLNGRGFSPISVWSSPEAVLFEVHNTAGEAHAYLMPRQDLTTHQAWKRLWVSPFSNMLGQYTFGYQADTDKLALNVLLKDADGPILHAKLSGPGQPLSSAALKAVRGAPGIAGRRTFWAILWEALKLRRKGLRPIWGPFAPAASVSAGSTSPSALGKGEIGGEP